MFEFEMLFDENILVELLVVTLAIAMLIMSVIQLLKEQSIIRDGSAGKWNIRLNTLVAFITFLLTQLGAPDAAAGVQDWVVKVAPFLVMIFVLALESKLLYEGRKFILGLTQNLKASR